jgi:inorganic phosphate transporter, PiT family
MTCAEAISLAAPGHRERRETSTVFQQATLRRERLLLTHLDPASALAIGLLIFSLILVIAFEATNGFHDAANAVATVIYTRSLAPVQAVVLSGILNFLGVLIGGISVAYALVELLPAEVLSPPSGAPAVGMLVALFVAALFWNIGTWWLGLPNSSSHCLIGAILGVALGNALIRDRSLADGVHWSQVGTVLKALAYRRSLAQFCRRSSILSCAKRYTTRTSINLRANSHRSGGYAAS